MTADEIITILGLKPHPEGGHYAETWRADAPEGQRGAGTAIYFLLKQGERRVVIDFLDRMAAINVADRTDLREAAAAIRRGETPRL